MPHQLHHHYNSQQLIFKSKSDRKRARARVCTTDGPYYLTDMLKDLNVCTLSQRMNTFPHHVFGHITLFIPLVLVCIFSIYSSAYSIGLRIHMDEKANHSFRMETNLQQICFSKHSMMDYVCWYTLNRKKKRVRACIQISEAMCVVMN